MQRVLIDGLREFKRGQAAGLSFLEVYFCFDSLSPDQERQLLEAAEPLSCPKFQLTKNAFEKIGYGNRNEGIVAVAEETVLSLEQLPQKMDVSSKEGRHESVSDRSPKNSKFLLVLDGIENPGNIGAVFRTAAAVGVDAILLTNTVSHPFNPNAIRSSLGTVFEMPFVCCEIDACKAFLVSQKIQAVATRIDGAIEYSEFDFRQPVAIVMGSEAFGVDEGWKDVPSVALPMLPAVDSLNISATAAVFCFETNRQRRS